MSISLDYTNSFVKDYELDNLESLMRTSHDLLHEKKGPGSEFTGWLDLPKEIDKYEFMRIKSAAKRIMGCCDAFIVIGIGGSYLGARACIEALSHSFYNLIAREKRGTPEIYFVGNNISSEYLKDIFEAIEGKDICINVISKSGTTIEPAIAFRLFKDYIENKYGKDEANNRIFATTDKSKGALRKLADKEGYETFVIPDDIGGRYSIFTAVGLLPITVAGIDIDMLMEGAYAGLKEYTNTDIRKNPCYQYAVIRNILYRKGKDIEILVSYDPKLQYLSEWWKQLFAESEGKDGRGIYPGSANFTTDLHSVGQLIQDGKRNIFETTINIIESGRDIVFKRDEDNLDGLNYLDGKTVDLINKKAFEGTIMAHVNGNVPNLIINIPNLNEYNFGKLIYFFEKACAISGYILGVNPFDQPGVEEYKKNLFQLLDRPGYTVKNRRFKRLRRKATGNV